MKNNDSVCYTSKILNIEPIPNADKIELAVIGGWKSIVPKNSLKVGDLVLCITTDAVIPQEFGEKHGILNYLRKGNRVRTVKLRGVYSDCIILPTSEQEEDLDMMETLGIFKYQEPEKIVQLPNGRRIKQKDNPNFNKYYKFPNIKNVPDIFSTKDEVVVTRKIHGSNGRWGIVKKSGLSFLDRIKKFFGNRWIEYEYVYGSHNVIKGSDSNGFYSTDIWEEVDEKHKIKEKLWNFVKNQNPETVGSGIILYGEVYGQGVQGEKYSYNLKDRQAILFDIELDKEYINRDHFEFLIDSMNLPKTKTLYRGIYDRNAIDFLVNNQFIENTKSPHEGVVVSHISGDRSKIAKFINPDYLIFSEKYEIPENH